MKKNTITPARLKRAAKISRDTGVPVEVKGASHYIVAGKITVTTLAAVKRTAMAIAAKDPYYTNRIKNPRRKFPPMSQADKALAIVRSLGHPDHVAQSTLAAWARDPRDIPSDAEVRRMTGTRKRKKNPAARVRRLRAGFPMPSAAQATRYYTLKAVPKKGVALKYTGGIRFAAKGRAALFASKDHAMEVGRALAADFPVLRKYKLVVSA